MRQIRRFSVVIILLLFIIEGFATSYVIIFTSSKKVKIGNVYARKDLVINDIYSIKWASQTDAMEIMDSKDGNYYTITAKTYNDIKAVSLSDYMTRYHHLATYGVDIINPSNLCLLNNLYLDVPLFFSNIVEPVYKVQWQKGKKIKTEVISKTENGRQFVIPRKLLKAKKGIIQINILECDGNGNSLYLYKDLQVEVLPLKSK